MAGRPKKAKRADGRYKTTLTYEDQTGVKRRAEFYGRTQAEANGKREDARKRLAAGGPIKDASCTLAGWLDLWRETFLKGSDRATATKTLYAYLTRNHVETRIGHVTLDRLKPSDVVRLMTLMEADGLSASTRRNTYAALRGALTDAVADGLLMTNPVEKAKRPRSAKAEALALTTEEAGRFVQGSAGLRYADALRLILYTGMRRGEALGLRWEGVDLDRGEARVSGSLVRRNGALTVSDTKTMNSRRTIALSPPAVALLRAHRATQAAERLKAGDLWRDSGFVFTTEFGEPADPRNLLRAVKISTRKAGLSATVGAHTLRHTYATVALLNGVPLHVVSRNLGHSSIAITADIYGHLTDDAMQEAAQKVSDAFAF